MSDLKLTQIWIYPIKSLGGISLPEASVMEKGLQYDRRWMLVDEVARCLTQRTHPRMALFKLTINSDTITVHYESDTLHVPLLHSKSSTDPILPVQIWDDTVSATEVSPTHSQWFSRHLDTPCRLVYFPEENSRPVDPEFQLKGEQVSLADAYPFLILGQASVAALNQRLTTPVPINRFRPNFVFSGGDPHEEDSWKDFTIGNLRFTSVKPCARCVLTTVNQETGEKSDEPLRTLSTYRKQGKKILFAQNLLARQIGVISVGDAIEVLTTKQFATNC